MKRAAPKTTGRGGPGAVSRPGRRAVLLAAVSTVCLAAAAVAQPRSAPPVDAVPAGPAESAPQAERPAAVRLVDLDGRSFSGTLTRLAEGRLAIGGPPPREFATSDLLRVEFADRLPRKFAAGPAVLLDNGDRLIVRPESSDGVNLHVSWPGGSERPALDVPLETVRAVVFDLPEGPEAAGRLLTALLDRDGRDDVVILRNGDRLTGELVALDEAVVDLEGPVGAAEIERAGVRAIGFSPDLISFPQPAGPRALVELSDGSRITARNLRLKRPARAHQAGPLLAFDAVFGPTLETPLAEVVSLRFFGGRAVFLSDLEPAEFRFTPYLPGQKLAWDWKRDRSVTGGPLRLRGTEYARGVGVHSRSELTYDLDGRYRSFLTVAGIDDAAGGAGNAVFAVEVDGRRVFDSEPQTGRSPPLAIGPLDVRGKRRLTLVVDFGDLADIQDHGNWCDAMLVRE